MPLKNPGGGVPESSPGERGVLVGKLPTRTGPGELHRDHPGHCPGPTGGMVPVTGPCYWSLLLYPSLYTRPCIHRS